MNDAQARRLAQQIFDRFDKQIVEATTGTNIEPAFIAGLIGNEAGKDRQGNIVRSASRFEKHVYNALRAVRDGGRPSYGGIRRSDIADASNLAIEALAHSYEATQIMGWHVVKNLHCTIADLRNPDKHFFYTVKLLQLNGYTRKISEDQMDREMREWNTGREGGKTYHANYVPNAQKIRAAYREIEKGRVHRSVSERLDVPLHVVIAGSNGVAFETFDGLTEDEIILEIPQAAEPRRESHSELPEAVPTENAHGKTAAIPQAEVSTQTAENIVNIEGEKNVPDNFVPETVAVEAPPPTGFMSKLKVHLAGLGIGTGTVAGLKEIFGIQLGAETVELLKVLVPTVLGLGFLGFLVWFVSEKVVGFKTLKLRSEIAADPTKNNIEIIPQ